MLVMVAAASRNIAVSVRAEAEVAHKLGVGQAAISRLEGREDMLLSTLYDYLTATGADTASIVVTVHGRRIELDLKALRNIRPEHSAT
jgi:hypothetical protein